MKMKTEVKNFGFRALCGFFLGVSVIAPGVSGSVMAVMMGIYRDLINIISNPFRRFKHNFFYLLPMGIGALVSLTLFVKLFAYLFGTYPVQARVLFMGLIAGGLPAIFKQAKKGRFKWQHFIGILGAFTFAGVIGVLARVAGPADVSAQYNIVYLCITGAVAGASSMIPGMSVSMILMLLGVYDYLLSVASSFNQDLLLTISVLLPVGICFVVGMVLFSKLTKLVFDKFHTLAYFMVFGFMCGTLTAIFPNSAPDSVMGWVFCAVMLIVGLFISALFQYLGKKFNAQSLETPATAEEPTPGS